MLTFSIEVTNTDAELLHPYELIAVTEYVPPLLTVMDGVLAPVFHT